MDVCVWLFLCMVLRKMNESNSPEEQEGGKMRETRDLKSRRVRGDQ